MYSGDGVRVKNEEDEEYKDELELPSADHISYAAS